MNPLYQITHTHLVKQLYAQYWGLSIWLEFDCNYPQFNVAEI